MFHRLREPFGKAGLIVAALALVFAMLGGAYAAENSGGDASASAKNKRNAKKGKQGGLNAKQKRQVIALAKRFAGKQGPQGPQGLPGAPGANGLPGANGTNGTAGTSGKSVVVGSFTGEDEENEIVPEACDLNGGLEVEVEGSGNADYVCNGGPGLNGTDGSPWTAGGTLPSEETETGVWGHAFAAPDIVFENLSFPIPLENAVPEANIHFIGSPDTNCPGTAADPQALPGHLCIYQGGGSVTSLGAFFSSPSGVVFGMEDSEPTFGSWAVTAP